MMDFPDDMTIVVVLFFVVFALDMFRRSRRRRG
jgi:hypothetical protein